MSDFIIAQNCNDVYCAYYHKHFWRWDSATQSWKESRLVSQTFEFTKEKDRALTPEKFLNSRKFTQLDEFEIDSTMLDALKDAKPCKTAPVEPVTERPTPSAQYSDAATAAESQTAAFPAVPEGSSPTTETAAAAQSAAVPASAGEKNAALSAGSGSFLSSPAAPTFDFGADDQTNALLLQDAQTFIVGTTARIMAAKHAHDLCANNKNGTWGKWCATVGISRDTGDRFVNIAAQCGNIQLEGKSILDVQPMKLLYAAAKPSTPQEVKQAVFSGDITTYKEYQDLMAQLKAEKSRADSVEAQLEAAQADVTGLTEQNSQLKEQVDAAEAREEEVWKMHDKAEARAKDAESQLAGSRQVAEAAKLRADKYKAENDALKKQPITAVVDEEAVDRLAGETAYEIAADMTAEYKARQEQDARDAYDSVLMAGRSMLNTWQIAKPSLRKLPPEQREAAANQLIRTLGQIQGEVSQCL